MALTIGVLFDKKFRAREKVCPWLVDGITKIGDKAVTAAADEWLARKLRMQFYREPFSDVLLFYGFGGGRASIVSKAFEDYKRVGKKAIYIDLGYFNNKARDGRYGYHRFSINARHPTAYFQNIKHKDDRFRVHGRSIESWKQPGQNIVLCGMSEKCAEFEGFKFEEWERQAIQKIRAVTKRPIIYRPKPRNSRSQRGQQYPPIPGVDYSDPTHRRLTDELNNAWAVVSHHSNAGIDAIIAGIPCFSDEGVATKIGHTDLAMIESPRVPSDKERRQFLADVAYCQFNRHEISNGTAWRHFKDEGLVP